MVGPKLKLRFCRWQGLLPMHVSHAFSVCEEDGDGTSGAVYGLLALTDDCVPVEVASLGRADAEGEWGAHDYDKSAAGSTAPSFHSGRGISPLLRTVVRLA
eukprot:SAG11_NODE_4109_length_2061_cov_1.398063_2_plen_101_part_00